MDTTNIKTSAESQINNLIGNETNAELLALSKTADSVGADRIALDAEIQNRIATLTSASETKTLLALAKAVEPPNDAVPIGGLVAINQDGPLVIENGKHYLISGSLETNIDAYPSANQITYPVITDTKTVGNNADICKVADGYLTYENGNVYKYDNNMLNPVEFITGVGTPVSIGANSTLIYLLYHTGTVIKRYTIEGAYLGGDIDVGGYTSVPRSLALTDDTLWFGASQWVHNLNLDGTAKPNLLSLGNPAYSGGVLMSKSMLIKNNELWVSVLGTADIIVFDFLGAELRRIPRGNVYIADAIDVLGGEMFWGHVSTSAYLYRYGLVVGTPSAKTDTDSGYALFERIK